MTDKEPFRMDSDKEEPTEPEKEEDTFGLELDLTWAVELKDTIEAQYRPINKNCVRRDVRYPLYLISFGEAANCKCLAHLTQVTHKDGEQKSEMKTILKKVIPALPNMTWFCLDEVEAKLYLVFGRIERGMFTPPVYYFKQFDLDFGALDSSGCRNITIVDESQAMLRIKLGNIDCPDSLMTFLSPNYSTLLFYACKMERNVCPVNRPRIGNYIGTLCMETAGSRKHCRTKSHDYFVSWATPFDLVFMNKGTSLAMFPIPIEDCSHSDNGLASVRVYSLIPGEHLELHPTTDPESASC